MVISCSGEHLSALAHMFVERLYATVEEPTDICRPDPHQIGSDTLVEQLFDITARYFYAVGVSRSPATDMAVRRGETRVGERLSGQRRRDAAVSTESLDESQDLTERQRLVLATIREAVA